MGKLGCVHVHACVIVMAVCVEGIGVCDRIFCVHVYTCVRLCWPVSTCIYKL